MSIEEQAHGPRSRKTVTVRGLVLGAGLPKICTPIGGRTEAEIFEKLPEVLAAGPDLLEWRADDFADLLVQDKLCRLLERLRQALPEKLPLLFTVRSRAEGGSFDGDADAYAHVGSIALESGCPDLIDFELLTLSEAVLKRLLLRAWERNIRSIVSSHDFDRTPPEDVMLGRLMRMQALGADLPKLAVMPETPRDVLRLLSVTEQFASAYAEGPFITMSMGRLGLVSRLCGECFGSALTFGAAGFVSAPGQPGVQELREALQLLHA